MQGKFFYMPCTLYVKYVAVDRIIKTTGQIRLNYLDISYLQYRS